MPPVGDGYSSISDDDFDDLITSQINIQIAAQWLYNVKKYKIESTDDPDTINYYTAVVPIIFPVQPISDHKENPQLRFYAPDEPQQYLKASTCNTLYYAESSNPTIFGGNVLTYLDIFYFVKKEASWYVGTSFAATVSADLNTIQTTYLSGEATNTITRTIIDTFYS